MATSGQKTVQFTDYNSLQWTWELKSLNPANKTANISWKAYLIAGEHGAISSYTAKTWKLHVMDYDKIKESDYSGTAYLSIDNNETKQIASGSFEVGHTTSASGRTSIEFTLPLAITFNNVYLDKVTVSYGFVLDAPPSGGTLTSVPNFTDEENPTITYSFDYTGTGVSTHLELYIADAPVAFTSIPVVSEGSFTWDLTEKKYALLSAASKAINNKATFKLTTTISGTKYTSSLSSTMTVVNCEPTLAPVVTNENGTTYILAHDNRLSVAANAQPAKEASITSTYITYDGKSTTGSYLYDVASSPITVTAIDSRGLVVTKSIELDLIPYIPLTCDVSSTKSEIKTDNTVDVTFTISGQFYNGSFNDGGSGNAVSTYYRYKINSGSYTSWEWVSITTKDHRYSATVTINIPYEDSITFEAYAVDSFSTVTAETEVVKVTPIFDWSQSDFRFNVPVTINGGTVPYVVDSGTFTSMPSATFYWRKWSDGLSECWGRKSFSVQFQNSNWGGWSTTGAISASNIELPEGLFLETPVVTAQLAPRSVGGILMVPGGSSATSASKTQTGAFEIARATFISGLSNAYTINYYIRGRWV